MIKKQTFFIFLFLFTYNTKSQVKITDSKNSEINSNVILELESNNKNKGFLLPRLALNNINSPFPLNKHVPGMVVYNTAIVNGYNGVQPSVYLNDGSKWVKLSTKSNKLGDLKNSFSTSDSNGWYLLNGRSISTLPTNAKAVAQALGFNNNLPNLTDAFLKNKSNSEAMNIINGSNNITITQANLPNVNFIGSTSTVGDHTHSYIDNPSTTIVARSGSTNPLASTTAQNFTTSSNTHSHTINLPLGGSNQPIEYKPKSIITNIFIYLGSE
ncbi:hypothetical protein [Chishuiella sp.]|uniref:hypothetical protein n=1 Tax=Chishuiella sp. TaxID=1969467 RepID=UPI0028B14C05|nr:hypothetical protein [Chishuiella sp.]